MSIKSSSIHSYYKLCSMRLYYSTYSSKCAIPFFIFFKKNFYHLFYPIIRGYVIVFFLYIYHFLFYGYLSILFNSSIQPRIKDSIFFLMKVRGWNKGEKGGNEGVREGKGLRVRGDDTVAKWSKYSAKSVNTPPFGANIIKGKKIRLADGRRTADGAQVILYYSSNTVHRGIVW